MNNSVDDAVASLLESEYGISGEVTRLTGENDNYLVVDPAGRQYVLKLCAPDEPALSLDLENRAVETASATCPDLTFPTIVPTHDGTVGATLETATGAIRGRLLQYVDGTPWSDAGPASDHMRSQLGMTLARLARALASVQHAGSRRTHKWDLTAASRHIDNVSLIEKGRRRQILDEAFLLYTACALPRLDRLPRSLIHGDLNDENIMVSNGHVSGLLDFGDCLDNPRVCDLAIALAYVLLDEDDPLTAGAEIVRGYHQEFSLTAAEVEVLFPLMCGRLATSVTIAALRKKVDPDRSAWFVTEDRAWQALERYVEVEPLKAAEVLSSGTDLKPFADSARASRDILKRRERHFCGALAISYTEPLKVSRGRQQFLYDESERPYLDLYNNVCHVGHCHPRVVDAGARQMERLNTNTRYVYGELVEYAERLCSTLPSSLQYCFFVNSGSEANELALRLARTHTGHDDLIVVDGAYHGHTTTMIDISPYKFMGPGGHGVAPDWVHVVPVADGYRGPFKGQGRAAGVAYGSEVGRVISGLSRAPAGFITESLQSCGGQVIPPEGYFETAFSLVRDAGGVCIVDEVQAGFGRVGTRFWGFELQEVVPDIVVMGKPIGNGHPMAAVVTTKEIAESLADAGMEFFATFGGNPVSCAVGMAVLDVIRDEGLQENALRVGSHFLDRLTELKERHALIGDVRGVGLFIGIELVRDRETLEPADREAALFVEALKKRRILTGTDGPFHNVVKIKPPLVISLADVDRVVRAMDDILPALA